MPRFAQWLPMPGGRRSAKQRRWWTRSPTARVRGLSRQARPTAMRPTPL